MARRKKSSRRKAHHRLPGRDSKGRFKKRGR